MLFRIALRCEGGLGMQPSSSSAAGVSTARAAADGAQGNREPPALKWHVKELSVRRRGAAWGSGKEESRQVLLRGIGECARALSYTVVDHDHIHSCLIGIGECLRCVVIVNRKPGYSSAVIKPTRISARVGPPPPLVPSSDGMPLLLPLLQRAGRRRGS